MRSPEELAKQRRNYYLKHKAKVCAASKRWRKENPIRYKKAKRQYLLTVEGWQSRNALSKRWKLANRRKVSAYNIVYKAVRSGWLKRLPCEKCGAIKVHAHHSDYSKPLDVQWLCVKHHVETHYPEQKEAA